MAKKDYKKLSDDIIKACGGVDNILSASHCMTRLRMNLKDSSKLNVEEAKKIPGVINIVVQNGEQQFVIGQDVPSLYEEVIKNDIKAPAPAGPHCTMSQFWACKDSKKI